MRDVYHYLHGAEWRRAHHIDHQLGAFHETGHHAIYCPAEWLVGQAAGRSDVSGRAPPDRFWKASAELVKKDPSQQPFVAVVGLHSSGSSCLAGVLYHLGLHLGNKLVGYYGTDPDKNCGFEAQGLMQICERAIPFPATSVVQSPEALDRAMQRWIIARQAEAAKTNRLAAGKYPMLCRLGDSLRRVCGEGLLVVNCDRPMEESIASLIRREPRRDPKTLREHQEWLLSGKTDLLASIPPERRITASYANLLRDPAVEIARLTAFLKMSPAAEQVQKACAYVKPEMQHVALGAVA